MPLNPETGAEIIDGPPEWFDEAQDALYPPYEEKPREPLELQYFDDIEMQLTGLWLVKGLLPANGMAVLYGHPGSGKTFLALDWALHVALGWEWQGRKVKQGVVLYVAAEGLTGLKNRVAAFRKHHGVAGVPFAVVPTAIDLQQPNADVERLIDAIKRAADHFDLPPAMIVIDTLSKTFGGGKENTDDMVPYVANCGRISASFECLTMPIHHRPKDAESEEPRGHSSLKGGADTVLLVESGETKKVRVTKQKDGEDGIEMLFRLKGIDLGEDEDGEPVTSCIVEPADVDTTPRGEAPEAKMQRLPDSAKVALMHLDDTLIDLGFFPPRQIPDTTLNRSVVGKVAKLDDWRTKFAEASGHGPDIKPDTISKAFRRSLDKLQAAGIVRVWGEFVWRTWKPRTRPDTQPDKNNHQDRTARTKKGPPSGGNPDLSGSMSGSVPPPENDDGPPAWMDEIPPLEPERDLDWMDNPILNNDWSE